MELELEKISVMLLETHATEKEWNEEVHFLKTFPIQTLFVLPYQVARAKHLLSGTKIEVGSIVDFPLGAGTFAKKAFETTQVYREGAREVYIRLIPEQIRLISKENYQIFKQLSFGEYQLGLSIDSSNLAEKAKRIISKRLEELEVKTLFLGKCLTVEQAMNDLINFRAAKNQTLTVQVSMENPTLLEIGMLFQAGASSVVLSNYREIFPLIIKNSNNESSELKKQEI